MTKTTIYCDHCNKELDEKTDLTDITIDCHTMGLNTDLCKDCFSELVDNLYVFCGKQTDS